MSQNAEPLPTTASPAGASPAFPWLAEAWRAIPAAELQILLGAIFSFAFPDSFATSGTLLNMLRVAGIMLVVAVGQSFALIVGGFDISVGANMGLVSIVCAMSMKAGVDVPNAAALGVLAGAVVGLINGVGIAVLRRS
jgi:ribose/xylose/arabinose/galactoside ABC-type transport system permease subunit